MRTLRSLTLRISLTLLLGICADSAQAWTQSEFVIGTYWDPYVSNNPANPDYGDATAIQTDIARFNQAKSAFFNLFTGKSNYSHASQGAPAYEGTKTALADYLLYLGGQTGMNVLIADNSFTFDSFQTSVAQNIVDHYQSLDASRRSAFYGYNLRDEPWYLTDATKTLCGASQIDGWAVEEQKFLGYFRTNDPSRLAYMNLLPHVGPSDACYLAYLNDYLNPTDPTKALDVASYDNYPFFSAYPNGIDPRYFWNLGVLRKAAGARPLWAHSLTMGFYNAKGGGSYPEPGDYEFRFMAFCPIAYGAKGIIYFTYVVPCMPPVYCDPLYADPNTTALVTGPDLSPTPNKFVKVQTLNNYLATIVGPIVMNSQWLGAYHKSSTPSTEVIAPEYLINALRTPIVSDISDAGALLGVFRHNTDPTNCHLLLVNKRLDQVTNMTVTLKGNYVGRVTVAPSVVGYAGSTTYAPVSVTYNASTGRSTFSTGSYEGGEGRLYRLTEVVNLAVEATRLDYDGDHKSDLSVFQSGQFKIDYSNNGFGSFDYVGPSVGTGNPVPADYDGDALTDLGLKTAAGNWSIDVASNGFGTWALTTPDCGGADSQPVPGDYDGDGAADLAVKTDAGEWKINYATSLIDGFDLTVTGAGDATWLPSRGDFDGDGRTDLSVANGTSWKLNYSFNGFGPWDITVAIPTNHLFVEYVPADYDGDGMTDLGLFTSDVGPKHGWQIDYASDGFGNWTSTIYVSKGVDPGSPTPGDFDGDGKADFSMKTLSGVWKIDYAAGGRGTWNASYAGYGTGIGLFRQQEDESAPPVPGRISLSASPNPFAGPTTIRYALTKPGPVRMAIYDVSGKRVVSLVDGVGPSGIATIEWSGNDSNGRRAPAGMYFCRLEAEGRKLSVKLNLTR